MRVVFEPLTGENNSGSRVGSAGGIAEIEVHWKILVSASIRGITANTKDKNAIKQATITTAIQEKNTMRENRGVSELGDCIRPRMLGITPLKAMPSCMADVYRE